MKPYALFIIMFGLTAGVFSGTALAAEWQAGAVAGTKTPQEIEAQLAQREAALQEARAQLRVDKEKQRQDLMNLNQKIREKIQLYEEAGVSLQPEDSGLSPEDQKKAREKTKALLADINREFRQMEYNLAQPVDPVTGYSEVSPVEEDAKLIS